MGERFFVFGIVFVFVFELLALFCFKDQFCQALCMTELILKTQDVFSWWNKTNVSVKAFILFLFHEGIME